MEKWPRLENPPVIVAVMEIRFKFDAAFDVSQYKKHDSELLKLYPIRQDHFTGNINLPLVPGNSTAQISSIHSGYNYIAEDKTKTITATSENLVFFSEGAYAGWDSFKVEVLNITENFKEILNRALISRVSIRFINRMELSNHLAPEEYFNTLISAREGTINNEIDNYLLRYGMNIPNTRIRANVIQSLEEKTIEEYKFILDIDVLDHEELRYKKEALSEALEKIRDVKNDIFFKNLTEKTLEQL